MNRRIYWLILIGLFLNALVARGAESIFRHIPGQQECDRRVFYRFIQAKSSSLEQNRRFKYLVKLASRAERDIGWDEEAEVQKYRDDGLHRSYLSSVLFDYLDFRQRFSGSRDRWNTQFAALFRLLVRLGVDVQARDLLDYSAEEYLAGLPREYEIGGDFMKFCNKGVREAPPVFLAKSNVVQSPHLELLKQACINADLQRNETRKLKGPKLGDVSFLDAASEDILGDLRDLREAAFHKRNARRER